MTDSYHFASVPQFRVGGYYRDGYGTLYRLVESSDSACAFAQRDNGLGGWYEGVNLHRLADGRFVPIASTEDKYHLIPGELHQVNGEWVPVEQKLSFPSGSVLTTSGDKIVGREEPEAPALNLSCIQQLRDLAVAQFNADPQNTDPYMRGLYNGLELALATLENREPVYRQQPAAWVEGGRFAGFIVSSGIDCDAVEVPPVSANALGANANLLKTA